MYGFADAVYFKVLFNNGTGKRFDTEKEAIIFGNSTGRPFKVVRRADYNKWEQTILGVGDKGIYSPERPPVVEVWNKKPA